MQQVKIVNSNLSDLTPCHQLKRLIKNRYRLDKAVRVTANPG
jgi:hypothetical protein